LKLFHSKYILLAAAATGDLIVMSCMQVPPITNYNVSDGQTYRYMSTDPLYPFGYGLSYSKMHYSQLIVTPTTIKPGQSVTVSVNVTNRGPYVADEVFVCIFFICNSY